MVVLLCVPSQTSVDPFSGVIVTRGTLTTSANGIEGWSKSASLWVGCDTGGDASVGGRAVFPDTKRKEGFGPSAVDVTWMTIGSAVCNQCTFGKQCTRQDKRLTGVDVTTEPVGRHGWILLNIAFVVVERAILPRLQLVCILDHFLIQTIQDGMLNHVFQNNKAIAGKGSNGNFEIALAKKATPELRC